MSNFFYGFAETLDAVVVSVGSLGPESTVARYEVFSEADRSALREVGVVGELLCNAYGHEGKIVDHPLNQRVMSVPLDAVRAAPIRVLAAGGLAKLAAIEGAIKLIKPTALVTDEIVARRLTRTGSEGDARQRPEQASAAVANGRLLWLGERRWRIFGRFPPGTRRGEIRDPRLRRTRDEGGRTRIRDACRAHRDVRQRRHALLRAAASDAVLFPPLAA